MDLDMVKALEESCSAFELQLISQQALITQLNCSETLATSSSLKNLKSFFDPHSIYIIA